MDNVKVPSTLTIIAGIWLILSPFILDYSNLNAPLWNDLVTGAAILIFAIVRASSPARTSWASWVDLVIGVWLILAPFALGYSAVANALWNDIILGIAVVVFSVWSGGSRVTTGEPGERFTQPS